MKSNFNDCLNRVLKDEGGYTNDPSDSGGATNFGITISDYRSYINPNGTALDVKGMNINDARRIYRTKYWDAIGGNNLPSGVDYTCFDYAVNSGVARATKALQEFKHLPSTSAIDSINNERTAFLEALAAHRTKDQKFLAGWLNRVRRVRGYSHFLENYKDNTSGPIVGSSVGAAGVIASQFWLKHEIPIVLGGFILAIIIGVAVHLYKRKTNG